MALSLTYNFVRYSYQESRVGMYGNDNKTVEGGPDRGAPEVVTQFHPYIEMATPAPHMQKVGNAEIPWWDCFGEVFLAEIP